MSNAGRPKKIDSLDLITLDDAVILIQEFFKSPEPVYSRRTLQNKICKKELHRYGPYHHTMVDKDEILNKLCRQKAG